MSLQGLLKVLLSIKVCVGRFGTDCNQTCPTGHYGRECIKKCACDINLCDVVLGCPTTATGAQPLTYQFNVNVNALIILVYKI